MAKFNIYTKTGDDGTTGLIGGTRVKKYDLRLETYGTIDELNAWIGVVKTMITDERTGNTLQLIQNKLFVIGSYLATDEEKSDLKKQLPCDGSDIKTLEEEIDFMQNVLPVLTNFVLPGGTTAAAQTHVARTVCRRAERKITELSENVTIEKNIIVFINRLSDFLFVLSRYINHLEDISDTFWQLEKK